MAYDFNHGNGGLPEESLDFAMGGVNKSYEDMRDMAIKNGIANASHGGSDETELSLEELDKYMGGIPYEQSSSGRGR